MTSKAPSRDDAKTTDPPATLLSLPKLPPLTEELRQLRREGAHIHYVPLDAAAAERERQTRVAGIARLPSSRARMWFWQACTIADWYEGTYEMNEQALRRDSTTPESSRAGWTLSARPSRNRSRSFTPTRISGFITKYNAERVRSWRCASI